MSEKLTTAPAEPYGLAARIESTSEIAKQADELYEPKSIQESRSYDGHQRYDSRDPLPDGHSEGKESHFLTLGTERHNPSHEVTRMINPDYTTVTARAEKEKKGVMVNAERLQGKYNDVMRQEAPGYKINTTSSIVEKTAGNVTAASTLEVSGTRHGKSVEKKLESDNPLVARMIAGIALKEVSDKSVARINQKRHQHQKRWEAEARQANKERSVLDKVRSKNEITAEEVMLKEAFEENKAYDKAKADQQAETDSMARTLDDIKNLPEIGKKT